MNLPCLNISQSIYSPITPLILSALNSHSSSHANSRDLNTPNNPSNDFVNSKSNLSLIHSIPNPNHAKSFINNLPNLISKNNNSSPIHLNLSNSINMLDNPYNDSLL